MKIVDRVALCLSGQPRQIESGFANIASCLMDANDYEFDVFVHCWYDKSQVGQKFDAAPWNQDTVETIREGLNFRIEELYNPISMIDEKEKRWFLPRQYINRGDQAPHIAFSMFYSVLSANNLKREHEQLTKAQYKWVIRSRFDIGLKEPIRLDELDNNAVHLHNNCQTHEGATPNSYNDWFAVMNSQNADIYADTFFNIDKFYTQGVKHTQECTLGAQFIENKVRVEPRDICYLIRG